VRQLIIIRGLPGSGTYELGEQMQRSLHDAPHWSSEKYEPNPSLYHPLLVPLAERWCFDAVYERLTSYLECTVIVSGMFLTRESIAPYRKLAEKTDATVVIVQTTDRGNNPSADVPEWVMEELRNSWEEL